MSVELAIIGPQRPFVLETLEREFTVHKAIDAPDKVAALQPDAGRIRGVVTNAMAGLPSTIIDALPNLEICAIMGVGLERTDLVRAKERGVVVTTTPVDGATPTVTPCACAASGAPIATSVAIARAVFRMVGLLMR